MSLKRVFSPTEITRQVITSLTVTGCISASKRARRWPGRSARSSKPPAEEEGRAGRTFRRSVDRFIRLRNRLVVGDAALTQQGPAFIGAGSSHTYSIGHHHGAP